MLRIVNYLLLLIQQFEPGTRAYGAPWLGIRTSTMSRSSHFRQGDFVQGIAGSDRSHTRYGKLKG